MTPSLTALVIANAIPLVGVLFIGWTVFPLVFLYWLENVVIGGFNVAKLSLPPSGRISSAGVYWASWSATGFHSIGTT